ncbi:MAG: YIP1 family protein [Pyrinomonadaceae bacterium]
MSDPNQGFQPPPAPPMPEAEVKAPRPTKLRIPAIVLFGLGLIILIAGLAKILPGGLGTGGAFIFFGIALFAFSFIPLPQPAGKAEPPMSGPQKLLAIFYAPTSVFRNLKSHPTWLAAFLVIGIGQAVYTAAFVQRLTPERIVQHTMDSLENSPIKPPPEQIEKMRDTNLQQAKQPIQRVQTAAKGFVGLFVFVSVVAALCLLGVLAFGGRINFWQAFAAVIWGYLPIILITKLVSLGILFIKEPEDIHPILNADSLLQDNLGILFTPAEHPALFVLGSFIGVLSFYGLWLRAKGLAHTGQKVSSTSAWGVAITLWVLALIVGMIFATLFSSFMS